MTLPLRTTQLHETGERWQPYGSCLSSMKLKEMYH